MTGLLEEKLANLEQVGVDKPLVEHIRAYVEQAGAPGLAYAPPFRMADQWQLPRREVLEAFLHSTRLGIFDLGWDLHCPSCRGVTEHAPHLNVLDSHSHCEFCQVDFTAGFDDLVEVNFSVNANIRERQEFSMRDFFAYWDSLEAVTSFSVGAGETHGVERDFAETSYYVFILDTDHQVAFPVHDTAAMDARELAITYDGETFVRDTKDALLPGPLHLRVLNRSDQPIEVRVVALKKYPWVSAATVASTQSFRDLFATELISPDETFSIRNLVFVFTDIKGSSALYERLGDSDAYLLVKEHFGILTDKVRIHNGAVVKTIGDAVMATFVVSTDAATALFEMQKAFDEFNAREKTRDDIIIKVGAHRGPCIAVSSNDRLDYFGRTINVAARVQGLSTGRDIVMSKSLYEEPAVRSLVDNAQWRQRHFQAELRGIAAKHDVVHLNPPVE